MSCVSPLSLTCIVSKYLWKYSRTFFLAWRPSHSSTLSQMTLLNWKGNTLNGACNRDGQGKTLSHFWPIFRYIWETVQGGSVVIMEYGTLIGSRMVFFKLCHFWRMTLSDPIIGVCVCVCVCTYKYCTRGAGTGECSQASGACRQWTVGLDVQCSWWTVSASSSQVCWTSAIHAHLCSTFVSSHLCLEYVDVPSMPAN